MSREEDGRLAQRVLARDYLLPFVKLTFPRYQVGPVELLIARELEWFEQEVAAKRSPRLVFEIPPRVGKSELVSRKYPGWILGRHPDWHVGLVSYGADLSEKLSRQARAVVMSQVYGEIFTSYDTEAEWASERVEIDPSSKSVSEWNIKPTKDVPQPGGMLAVGTKGALTGKGFEVLIIDDPIKDQDEADSVTAKNRLWDFYISTLYDRIEPGGGVVVVQQRWAPDDLVGRLLAAEDGDEEDFDNERQDVWRRITIPAQAEPGMDDALGREPGEWLPGRRTAEQWERAKAFYQKRGPRVWAAKFQQRPVAHEGAFFRPFEWFRFEDDDEDNEGPVFIFGDTSYAKRQGSDFNAFGVWRMETRGENVTFRLLEVYRERTKFPQLRRDIVDLCFKYGLIRPVNVLDWQRAARVYVEDKGSGQSLLQELMEPVNHPEYGAVRIPAKAWLPKKDQDKDARAHAVTPVMAEGRVALPKRAPWLAAYLQELSNFQGEGSIEHDDQVDMTTMALILMHVQRPARKKEMHLIPFEMVG